MARSKRTRLVAERARVIHLIRRRELVPVARATTVLPRQQHPDALIRDYFVSIKPLVDSTRAVLKKELYPYLPQILDEHAREHSSTRKDAGVADLSNLFKKARAKLADLIEPKRLWWLANEIATKTADFQKHQIVASVRAALGIDVSALEPAVTTKIAGFVADNVSLISSIPATYLKEVETGVMSAIRSGERWSSIAGYIDDRYNVGTNRAKLIARDQIGKFYGDVNKTRQENLGVTGYTWRTMNDIAVRDEHADREGEAFEWNDAPEGGHPGEDIQCRCYAEPDFSGIIEGLSKDP